MKKRSLLSHYGFTICLCCLIVSLCTIGLSSNAFGIYLPHIRALGFTATETSRLVSIRYAFNFLAILCVTKYYDRLSYRVGLCIAMVLAACGTLMFAFARTLPLLYAATALIGLGMGFGSMVPLSILVKRWFSSHRALALAVSASGTGLAAIIFSPVLTWLIHRVGLAGTFCFHAGFTMLCAVVVLLLVRDAPADKGLEPYGAGEEEPASAAAARPRPGLTRAQWVFMIAALVLFGGCAISCPSHISVSLIDGGTPEMIAALCVSLFGATITVGKWVYGWIVDKIGCYRSNFIFFGILVAAMVFFCIAPGNSTLSIIAAMLLGFGSPPATVGVSTWATDLSSEEDSARNIRRFQSAYIGGGMLLTNLPGVLRDAWGSYSYAFAIFAVLLLLSLTAIQTVYRRHGAHM